MHQVMHKIGSKTVQVWQIIMNCTLNCSIATDVTKYLVRKIWDLWDVPIPVENIYTVTRVCGAVYSVPYFTCKQLTWASPNHFDACMSWQCSNKKQTWLYLQMAAPNVLSLGRSNVWSYIASFKCLHRCICRKTRID